MQEVRCEICGKIITGRRRKYCPECARKPNKKFYIPELQGKCVICGCDISDKANNAKYCDSCNALAKNEQAQKAHSRRGRAALSMTGNISQCRTCTYWNQEQKWCDYLTITGQARRCEPSPNCTKYERKVKTNDTKRKKKKE